MKRWSKNLKEGKAKPIQASIVISSYNKPKELQLCLEGYRRQSFLEKKGQTFQVIVADDGSVDEIEKIYLDFSESVSFPVTFLQKEHDGWGKLKMLNWAILEALSDQLIFTDGDCIPHREFVQNHLDYFQENIVSCGRRIDFSKELSASITIENINDGKLESPFWLGRAIFTKGADFGTVQGFFLPTFFSKGIRLLSRNLRPTLFGSNFAIHKKWLVEVNGFDETFQTPGIGEDADLERRLKMTEVRFQWITYRAIQFHLWHPKTVVGESSIQTFEELKKKGNKQALKGLKEFKQELEKSGLLRAEAVK